MIIKIVSISRIKGIDIRDNEISITLDKNSEALNEVLHYVDENTNLAKNTLDYLAKNLIETDNFYIFAKCYQLLIKNGYEIKLTDECISKVISYIKNLTQLTAFYNILKSLNLLNKKYEEIIANKVAFEFETYYKEIHLRIIGLTDFEYVLENFLAENSTNRELIEKAVKLFASRFIKKAIDDIPLWLRRHKHRDAFSYFLTFINVLEEFGLKNAVKDEIEVLKNELKKYKKRIRRAVKNRIKKEENRNELKTLISILEDRSLYKYLL